MRKTFLLGLVGVLMLTGAAFAGEVRIGAGAAATENIFKKIKAPFEQATGITLTLEAGGPVDGFKKMDTGSLDAVVAGVEFNEWIAMLEKEGYKVADKAAYMHQDIGKDIIKVIVNKSVSVASLSQEQLKGIFTGKIMNWSEVGGADAEIGVVFGKQIQGTQNTFKKAIMGGEEYASDRIEVATADDVKKKVVEVPGSIGLAPLSLADDTVTVPQIPEVGRTIVIATKGAPKEAVQKVIDYIKGDGQALITK
jgi:phosphate transport system substrate-binding protein